MYSLDTTVAVDVFRRPTTQFRARLLGAQADGLLGLSSLVLFELCFGLHKGTSSNGRVRLDQFLSGVAQIFEFDSADAESAGELGWHLESRGEKIGPYDTLIAAQARRRGLVLVTANTREFSRVPGLMLENWRA